MTIFVKPLNGLIVRDPRTKVKIPEEGMNVSLSGPEGSYWRRRVKDGSLITSVKKPNEIKGKDGVK